MPSHKIAKISSDIARVISEIIFTEAKDELLKSITITGCKVSRDLSYAKVYFTSLSNLDKETVTRDYVYDCLSEHEKYNIFSSEITQKIKELLVQRRILGNQNGALKTNEFRGR